MDNTERVRPDEQGGETLRAISGLIVALALSVLALRLWTGRQSPPEVAGPQPARIQTAQIALAPPAAVVPSTPYPAETIIVFLVASERDRQEVWAQLYRSVGADILSPRWVVLTVTNSDPEETLAAVNGYLGRPAQGAASPVRLVEMRGPGRVENP